MRTRQRIDSSSIIAYPVNFDYFRRSLKYDAKNSTYIYIYHPLDNRYGFLSIGNTKNHVATLTCLEWILKYNLIILAPKLMSHVCALLIDNIGNYLYMNHGRFKFEIDPHQFNLRLHHFSQFQRIKKIQKLAGLWLACEMVDHIGIYGSKVAGVPTSVLFHKSVIMAMTIRTYFCQNCTFITKVHACHKKTTWCHSLA